MNNPRVDRHHQSRDPSSHLAASRAVQRGQVALPRMARNHYLTEDDTIDLVEAHAHQIFQISSKRAVTRVVRKGAATGNIYVDVVLTCRASKVVALLEALDEAAMAHGALLIRNKPGLAQERVVLRYPPKPSPGPPPVGDRQPRQPKPSPPSLSATATVKPPAENE